MFKQVAQPDWISKEIMAELQSEANIMASDDVANGECETNDLATQTAMYYRWLLRSRESHRRGQWDANHHE